MSDSGLKRCLSGMTVKKWYRLLNGKVFFWLTEERLLRMLHARPYREKEHCVLVVKTQSLVTAHEDRIHLSPINSGCTKPYPAARSSATFKKIKDYPFDEWRRKRGESGDAIVELAIEKQVRDIMKHVVRIEMRRDQEIIEVKALKNVVNSVGE